MAFIQLGQIPASPAARILAQETREEWKPAPQRTWIGWLARFKARKGLKGLGDLGGWPFETWFIIGIIVLAGTWLYSPRKRFRTKMSEWKKTRARKRLRRATFEASEAER